MSFYFNVVTNALYSGIIFYIIAAASVFGMIKKIRTVSVGSSIGYVLVLTSIFSSVLALYLFDDDSDIVRLNFSYASSFFITFMFFLITRNEKGIFDNSGAKLDQLIFIILASFSMYVLDYYGNVRDYFRCDNRCHFVSAIIGDGRHIWATNVISLLLFSSCALIILHKIKYKMRDIKS